MPIALARGMRMSPKAKRSLKNQQIAREPQLKRLCVDVIRLASAERVFLLILSSWFVSVSLADVSSSGPKIIYDAPRIGAPRASPGGPVVNDGPAPFWHTVTPTPSIPATPSDMPKPLKAPAVLIQTPPPGPSYRLPKGVVKGVGLPNPAGPSGTKGGAAPESGVDRPIANTHSAPSRAASPVHRLPPDTGKAAGASPASPEAAPAASRKQGVTAPLQRGSQAGVNGPPSASRAPGGVTSAEGGRRSDIMTQDSAKSPKINVFRRKGGLFGARLSTPRAGHAGFGKTQFFYETTLSYGPHSTVSATLSLSTPMPLGLTLGAYIERSQWLDTQTNTGKLLTMPAAEVCQTSLLTIRDWVAAYPCARLGPSFGEFAEYRNGVLTRDTASNTAMRLLGRLIIDSGLGLGEVGVIELQGGYSRDIFLTGAYGAAYLRTPLKGLVIGGEVFVDQRYVFSVGFGGERAFGGH